MRKLEIDWMALDTAFQSGSWEKQFYLYLETGEEEASHVSAEVYLR